MVSSVVCLCLLFCSAWMCCLEDVCYCDMFSGVNLYLAHLKLCVGVVNLCCL